MRILLVNYRYFISGGPERYLFNIKKKLENEGYEVIPFSIHSVKNVPSEYSKYFVEPIGGRNVVYYEEYRKSPKVIAQMLSRSIYSFEVKRAIQKEISDLKPDLVYVIHYVNKLSPSVIRGAKQMGLPVVLRLSDYFLLCPRFDFLYKGKVCEDCPKKGYWHCLKRRCVKDSLFASAVRVFSMKFHQWIGIYKDIDAYVTPSKFLKNKLEEYGFPAKKIFCIPTFVPSEEARDLEILGSFGLYIGRLTEEKGVETLIKAYQMLPGYQLKIVGDDSTKEGRRLKKYAEDNQLNQIEFLGFRSGEELKDILYGARFVISPSIWYENLPNTILEAYAAGKPVLAAKIGSQCEAVEEGKTGFLFPPGDAQALAALIKKMDDGELTARMGINCRSKANETYSAERHVQTLTSLFNRVIMENQQ